MVSIDAGLVIDLNSANDGTTSIGFRRALAVLLAQDTPGVAKAGRLGTGHFNLMGTGGWAYSVSGGGLVIVRAASGGAYLVGMPTSVTVPTTPPDGVNPRIDVVYARQPDPTLDGSSVDVDFVIDVAHGAAAATPVAPAIPSGAIELGRKIVAPADTNTNTGAAITNRAPVTGLNVPSVAWDSIPDKPALAPLVHTHDDRYYTKDQIGAIVSPLAAWSSVTENFYNRTQIDTRLGTKQDKPTDGSSFARREPGSSHSIGFYTTSDARLWFRPIPGNAAFDVRILGTYDLGSYLPITGGTLSGDLYIPGMSAVSSGYVAMYRNGDGRLGISPSSIRFKKDVRDKLYTREQLRAIRVVSYRLRASLFDPADPHRADPPVDVGVIAEELVDAGLSEFVAFDTEGEPLSVHYERLALVAIGAVQELLDEFDQLAARVDRLEGDQ